MAMRPTGSLPRHLEYDEAATRRIAREEGGIARVIVTIRRSVEIWIRKGNR
jgi:hypothetical protein